VFDPGKTIKPCLMFDSKAGAYPSETLSGAPLLGKLLASPKNH